MASRAIVAALASFVVIPVAAAAAAAGPSPSPAASVAPVASPGVRDFQADIATAKDLQRRGRSIDAIALLAGDHKLDPTDRDVTVALAQTYSYSGDQGQAIALLDILLGATPDDVDARIVLAQAYAFNHDYAAAEAQYGIVLKAAPDDEDAQVGLAQTFTFEGRYADAKAQFEKVLAHDAKNFDARVGMADAEGFSGDYERARADYRVVLDAQPDNTDALVGLASVEYWLNNVPAAIALDERALALDPGDSDARDLKKQLSIKTSPQAVATMTTSHSNDGATFDYQLEERYFAAPTTSMGLVEELYQIGNGGVAVQTHRLGIVATYQGTNRFGVDLRIVGSKFGGVAAVTDSVLTLFDANGGFDYSLGTSTGGVDGSVAANGGQSAPGQQSALVRINALFGDVGYTRRNTTLDVTAQAASYNDGNLFHEFTIGASHLFGFGAYDSLTPGISFRSAGFSNTYSDPKVAASPGYYNYTSQHDTTLTMTAQRLLTDRLSVGVIGGLGYRRTVVPTYGPCYPRYCPAGSFTAGSLPFQHLEPYFDYEGDRFSFTGAYYDDHYGGAGTAAASVQPYAANTLDVTFSIRLP